MVTVVRATLLLLGLAVAAGLFVRRTRVLA